MNINSLGQSCFKFAAVKEQVSYHTQVIIPFYFKKRTFSQEHQLFYPP